MNKNLDKIQKLRRYLLQQIDGLTPEQLNEIPAGYNNNIIWNLGHMISAQQTVCYIRSGLPISVDDQHFSPYMTGSKPGAFVTESEIGAIKEALITSMDQLQSDYSQHKFGNYSPSVMIPKVYGFEVSNIDDAIDYLLYHEGLHAGCIFSIKRLLL